MVYLLLIVIILIWGIVWLDLMKILIFLEIYSIWILLFVVYLVVNNVLSFGYFIFVMIFLVCESRLGFIIFILLVRMRYETVSKLIIVEL